MTLVPVLARLVLRRSRWLFAGGDSRDAEILALPHHVLVLQRQINRPKFNETDRTVLALLASVMDQARRGRAMLIMHPVTVLLGTADSLSVTGPDHQPLDRVVRPSIPTSGG